MRKFAQEYSLDAIGQQPVDQLTDLLIQKQTLFVYSAYTICVNILKLHDFYTLLHGFLLILFTFSTYYPIINREKGGKMRAGVFEKLKSNLQPGKVYRRTDLSELSTNVDRHLSSLVKDGSLKKLQQGLYLCPETTVFGEALPNEDSLLRSFLKDDHFVVFSFNSFNSLNLGTTQLYNRRVVFNRKRLGQFNLGGRSYLFYRWREAPKTLTQEFMVVALLNHLDELAEDKEQVLHRLQQRLPEFNKRILKHAMNHYGTYSTQLKLKKLFEKNNEN